MSLKDDMGEEAYAELMKMMDAAVVTETVLTAEDIDRLVEFLTTGKNAPTQGETP